MTYFKDSYQREPDTLEEYFWTKTDWDIQRFKNERFTASLANSYRNVFDMIKKIQENPQDEEKIFINRLGDFSYSLSNYPSQFFESFIKEVKKIQEGGIKPYKGNPAQTLINLIHDCYGGELLKNFDMISGNRKHIENFQMEKMAKSIVLLNNHMNKLDNFLLSKNERNESYQEDEKNFYKKLDKLELHGKTFQEESGKIYELMEYFYDLEWLVNKEQKEQFNREVYEYNVDERRIMRSGQDFREQVLEEYKDGFNQSFPEFITPRRFDIALDSIEEKEVRFYELEEDHLEDHAGEDFKSIQARLPKYEEMIKYMTEIWGKEKKADKYKKYFDELWDEHEHYEAPVKLHNINQNSSLSI